MEKSLLNYYENLEKPWSKLFYRLIFAQLNEFKNCMVLDFGSGFGITADHLAKDNKVIAIEPNIEMVNARFTKNSYEQ